MDPNNSAFVTNMIFGFIFGLLLSWSVGLAPALIYRYVIYRHPVEKKKVRWRLAPIVVILMFLFKATMANLGGTPWSPNPLPWIIIYFIGKWIMTRESKSKFKHACLLSTFGLFLLLSIGSVLIGSYFNKMIPDKTEVRESVQTDPVHLALTQGDIQKMKQLLGAGASPNKIITKGHTPLITASRLGRADMASLLLRSGANPKHQDDLGWTPLHHAILQESANLSVITLLIESGADVNAQDHRLRTPLHRAAQYGYVDVVQYLLKVGANPSLKDDSNWTPYERAESFGTADAETKAKVKAILRANR
jgi:hypothetical protein